MILIGHPLEAWRTERLGQTGQSGQFMVHINQEVDPDPLPKLPLMPTPQLSTSTSSTGLDIAGPKQIQLDQQSLRALPRLPNALLSSSEAFSMNRPKKLLQPQTLADTDAWVAPEGEFLASDEPQRPANSRHPNDAASLEETDFYQAFYDGWQVLRPYLKPSLNVLKASEENVAQGLLAGLGEQSDLSLKTLSISAQSKLNQLYKGLQDRLSDLAPLDKALIVKGMTSQTNAKEANCSLMRPCGLLEALEIAKLRAETDRGGSRILLRAGEYQPKGPILIEASGTLQNPLTLAAFPGERVVISGGAWPSSADGGLIEMRGVSHVRISGLELRNLKSKKPQAVIAGILVIGSNSFLEIDHNHIHHLSTLNPQAGTSALGIAIYGTHPSDVSRYIHVHHNHLHDLKLGFSESLTLAGNVEHFQIEDNKIHDVDNIGIDAAGGYGHSCWQSSDQDTCDKRFDYARYGLIRNNHVYRVDSRKNPAYSDNTVNAAPAIYVDGGRYILVEGNTVHEAGVGLSLSSEQAGGLAAKVSLIGNHIYKNWRTGLNLGPENAQKGWVQDCLIADNRFEGNDTSPAWGGEIYMEYHIRRCDIRDNYFYADNQGLEGEGLIPLNLIINDFLNREQSESSHVWLYNNRYESEGELKTWFWQGQWFNHELTGDFASQSQPPSPRAQVAQRADPSLRSRRP
ncbi:MAG: right-handed parallel beta-helix repeat-containing protein [Deinococcales bacterium]